MVLLQDEKNERRPNEKTYTCTHCQKNFSTKGHLKVSSFNYSRMYQILHDENTRQIEKEC